MRRLPRSTDLRGDPGFRRSWGIDPYRVDRSDRPWLHEVRRRRFAAYFWIVGLDCIQLGVHVSLLQPNIEIHVPFGFLRIGWVLR